MIVFQVAILLFVAVTATAVVLTRNPLAQIIGLTFYGLIFAVMFFALQAPDVAFSQVVVGAVAIPLMALLTLAKIKNKEARADNKSAGKKEAA
jgi:energy-converting hydrogenase B subunit D